MPAIALPEWQANAYAILDQAASASEPSVVKNLSVRGDFHDTI
jgi:hypothetical protein